MVLQVPPSYTEHAKEFPMSPSNKASERNSNKEEDITRREFIKKAGMIAAGLIGAGAVGGGIGATIFGGKEKEPVATNPNVEPVTESVEQQQEISPDAKAFAEKYKDIFDDPISTYYAEMAYDPTHQYVQESQLDDSFVENYYKRTNHLNANGESELGFTQYQLESSAEYNQDTNIRIFNEFAVPQINRYMNLLSKSPAPEAVAIIDSEFRFLSLVNDKDIVGKRQTVDSLMNLAKEVVAKYGSAANYSFIPAVTDIKDATGKNTFFAPEATSINTSDYTVTEGSDGEYQYKYTALATHADDAIINVDIYDGQKVTTVSENVNNFIFESCIDSQGNNVSIGCDPNYRL